MPRIFYGSKDVDITWDCSTETENRQKSEGNRPDPVVTDKKMKEIEKRLTYGRRQKACQRNQLVLTGNCFPLQTRGANWLRFHFVL